MSGPARLGRVSQVSPLRVLLNGDTADAPAEAVGDFTGATAGTSGTEVVVSTVEGRRFAERVATTADAPWVAYTPALTNLTLGNGILSGRYKLIGKTVHAAVYFEMGSTSAMGSGPVIGVPVGAHASPPFGVGAAQLVDLSANTATIGWWRENGTVRTNTGGAAFGGITATTPFVWAVNDGISLSITYEAA